MEPQSGMTSSGSDVLHLWKEEGAWLRPSRHSHVDLSLQRHVISCRPKQISRLAIMCSCQAHALVVKGPTSLDRPKASDKEASEP